VLNVKYLLDFDSPIYANVLFPFTVPINGKDKVNDNKLRFGLTFKDEPQTALFKDPIRTAL